MSSMKRAQDLRLFFSILQTISPFLPVRPVHIVYAILLRSTKPSASLLKASSFYRASPLPTLCLETRGRPARRPAFRSRCFSCRKRPARRPVPRLRSSSCRKRLALLSHEASLYPSPALLGAVVVAVDGAYASGGGGVRATDAAADRRSTAAGAGLRSQPSGSCRGRWVR